MKPWLRRDARYLGVFRSHSECSFSVKDLSVALGMTAVFVETREDTNGIGQLDQINCRLQVVSEVDELPLDLLSGILLLFQNEHVVVEELLELLVRVVDAELLEAVVLEDFKTSNIETPMK